MKNIVLYAPPAAGKGTECESLVKDYGYEVLSIGQVLRNNRSMDTEIGRKIIETQDKGILTPDDIVAEALKNELKKLEGKAIIVDGYPRNINQAKLLDTVLDNYIVINLYVGRDLAMKRTLGRVTCPDCGKIYNIYFDEMKPKKDGVCDICGAELKGRSDDNENSFKVRFDVYEENAPKIIEYYTNKGVMYRINGGFGKENTHKEVKKILEG